METLQIKKDAAVKAHENAKKNGKKLLENLFGKETFLKDVTARIKTFDDVLKELDICPDKFNEMSQGLSPDEDAYRKLRLISKALNEGWEPNWDDSSEYKYTPYFRMGSSGSGFAYDVYDFWYSGSHVGSRLCFKSRDLAEYAGNQFTSIYKEFFIIK